MELARKMTPEEIPIQWSLVSIGLTTDPAKWREGNTEKTVGASTEKKMIPPSQTTSDNSIRKRNQDMSPRVPHSYDGLSSTFPKPSIA